MVSSMEYDAEMRKKIHTLLIEHNAEKIHPKTSGYTVKTYRQVADSFKQ